MNGSGPDVRVMTPVGNAGIPLIKRVPVGAQPGLEVTYVRRKVTAIVYTPEHTYTRLQDFAPIEPTGNEDPPVPIDNTWERVRVQVPSPPGTTAHFARVRVSVP